MVWGVRGDSFISSNLEQRTPPPPPYTHTNVVIRSVSATGGGAFKYETLFQSAGEQGIQIRKKDEIKCLIKGLDFLLQRVDGEAFEVEDTTGNKIPISFHQDESNLYPFLLVNVGTGVSIIKVNSPTQFERISGSGIGGGTYWGLVKLLTKVTTFEESLNLSLQGDERNVNMTVGDIYGGRDYDSLGLNADMTASFFAKFISKERDEIVTNGMLRLFMCENVYCLTQSTSPSS